MNPSTGEEEKKIEPSNIESVVAPAWSDQISFLPNRSGSSPTDDVDMLPSENDQSGENKPISKKDEVFRGLYGHKTGFLPLRRDLYENLLMVENNRVAKAKFFEPLDDLADKIVVPTEDTLALVDFNELFVKIELRSVLKIRLLFMQWAQELVHNTVQLIK